jgi:CDP-alcohol phosphatidyltransferase
MQFRKLFTKENVLTIPNLLSLIRLAIIPFICIAYFYGKYFAAAGLIVLSALTDIADGIIARKCNMTSDLGKMLDPFADKMTEGVLILALAFTYRPMIALVVTFALLEITKGIMGSLAVKKTGEVKSAKWFGKLNTAYLYETILVMIIFRDMDELVIKIKVAVAFIFMAASFVLYLLIYCESIRLSKADRKKAPETVVMSGADATEKP